MDEDFGTSIWATATSSTAPLSSPEYPTFPQSSFTVDQFDNLDGSGAQKDVSGSGDDDDDFGDFGEFGQAEDTTEEIGHFSEPTANSSSLDWEPLRLDLHPSRQTLEAQIEEILGPLWNTDDTSQALTDEDVREVGGLAQVLVTPDR
jgi:hypothetical protein